MLAPYIIIISIGLIGTILLNFIFGDFSIWYSILLTMLNFIFIFGIDGLIAYIVNCFPKKIFSPYKKNFKVSNKEKHFYDFIKIKKWKEYVMELDGLGKFKKNKVDSTNPDYLLRFLQENCCGEIVHILCVFAGVCNLIFLNYHFLNFSVSIIAFNAVLNIPPIFIQRYNRPKLLKIYEIKKKQFDKQTELKGTVIKKENNNSENISSL